MQAVRAKAFDSSYALASNLRNRRDARPCKCAIDVHAAGAAQSSATPELCARQIQGVTKDPEQGSISRDIRVLFAAVNTKTEIGHKKQTS